MKEAFAGDGYVGHLDHDDGLTAIYICQNLPKCTFYVQFIVYKSYFNKSILKRKKQNVMDEGTGFAFPEAEQRVAFSTTQKIILENSDYPQGRQSYRAKR